MECVAQIKLITEGTVLYIICIFVVVLEAWRNLEFELLENSKKLNNSKGQKPRCLKITEKVSLNIASEASYVYILSGQKLIKNAKNGPFWRVFENRKLAVKQCYQTGQF